MNEGSSKPRSPIMLVLCGLLAANLGLLWVQGAQLNRQHDTLRQLHTDIADLTDALDAYTNGDNSGDNGGNNGDGSGGSQDGSGALWAPAHQRQAPGHRLIRARFQDPQSSSTQPAPGGEPDMMDQGRKDQEDANKSARDAIAKARDDQEKLSISENYRKGQEERKVDAAQHAWERWATAAVVFLFLALLVRAWIIRRNG